MRAGRRRFLAQLAWLVVLAGRPAPAAGAAPAPADARLGAPLREVLAHLDSALVVGREYLRAHPEERDASRLAEALGSRRGVRALDCTGPALRRALDRRSRRDYAEGDVVVLRGWMLSRTEARLCGLAALLLRPAGGDRFPDEERPPR
jgi:hypothetical protein